MLDPEEDLATKEERIAWLRARGVRIEEPGTTGGYAGPALSGEGKSFVFVKIPVESGCCCEELEGPHAKGDALPGLLGPKFAGCDLSDAELQAHAAIQGQPQSVDVSVLRKLVTQGRAESFRLAVPTESNGREAVYAYLDEASELKSLAVNDRASAIAEACGFAGCRLRGDIYIGRLRWLPGGLVENIDFRLADVAVGSFWMTRAVTENLQHQSATQPEEHAKAQAAEEKAASGTGDGYTWKDEGEELEVVFQIPPSTGKKDVKIEFRRQEIRMLKPEVKTLKLYKAVDIDGCSLTLGSGQIVVTLEKCAAEPWPQLLKEVEGLYL